MNDTHAAGWHCSTSECEWSLVITGSYEYVGGDVAARLAFLEVLGHETRDHWPSKLLTQFVLHDVRMVDHDGVWELEPSPEAIPVVNAIRLPQVGEKVRVVGGSAPIGEVIAFVGVNTARVLWDGWSESLAVIANLEVVEK